MPRRISLFTTVALLLPAVASAQTVTFTDEAAFLAAVPFVAVESFEGLPATNTLNQTTIVTANFVINSPAAPDLGVWDMPAVWGGHATDGVQWVGHQTGVDELTVFDFGAPIAAWGMWFTDWGDFGTGEIVFENSLGEIFTVATTPRPNGGQFFWGMFNPSATFVGVTLRNTVPGEAYGLDQVYFGVPAGTNVLLAGSPGQFGPWMADVQAKIAATGRISGNIDMFDTSSGTPTAAMLAQYDAVLSFTDAGSQNAALLGDRLADYVDAGGGVVQATFSWHTAIPLAGRWQSGGYSPLTYAGQSSGTELFIGTRHLPGHAVLSDVASFSGGTASFHNTGVVAPGATAIADWTNGAPLVVEMGGFAGNIIGLNIYPPSSDARIDFWRAGTDGDLLLANALAYVAASCPCACDFDTSTGAGVCDLVDFTTFAGLFATGDPCACDIDTSTGLGVCDLVDFTTFAGQFAGGCP